MHRQKIACILFIFILGCAGSRPNQGGVDILRATELKPFGRTTINDQQDLELIGSASNFGLSFTGTECRVNAYVPSWLDHNYIQYELDGVYQKRIRLSSKTSEALVITAPNNGTHSLWIYKATEPHTGAVYIHSISGKNLKTLQHAFAPLIEFIGNSITCGAAADPSEVPCGTGVYHDQHNAYMAYGPRVARALGINFIVSSVSGIGIYRNWNTDGPTMPQVYEKLDFQEQNPKLWDFSTYTPKVVSIALGTNDFSHGDGKTQRLPFDSTRFVNHYIQFVQLVKSKYPSAQIALLSSPMLNGETRTLLQNCLQAVKSAVDARSPSSSPVALYFFEPMQARGCGGHPNVEDHGIMANELIPFFKPMFK
ncbi:MAG: GDSL-type esterase/lipase family protein [Flavisolibacter sp.]